MTKTKLTKSYQDHLISKLSDPDLASEYLNSVLEDIRDDSPIVALPMGPFLLPLNGPGDFNFELKISQGNKEVAVLESPFSLPVRIRIVS